MKITNQKPETYRKWPTYKSQILKMMKGEESIGPVYYTYCEKCDIFSKAIAQRCNQTTCSRCEKELRANETNYFVYFPIRKQIERTVTENWNSINTQTDNTQPVITDLHDGEILKKNQRKYVHTDKTIFSLTLNLDGANRFKSSNRSIWPILLTQGLLPPSIRYNLDNIILAGLFYSKKKPECLDSFLPLVEGMKQLQDKNIVIEMEEGSLKLLPIITQCVVDLPAKSHLQQITQFNGKQACTYCQHPGEQVKHGKRKFTRYTADSNQYDLRTHDETVKSMLRVEFSNTRVNGVKGKT